MKRSECTKESLCERGWKTCYSEESNFAIRYTYDEAVQAIQSGAKVKKEVCLTTKSVHIYIDGRAMLWRCATQDEIEEQQRINEQVRYEKAIKKIQARNTARMRRK